MEEDIKILENLERDIFKACECSLTSSSDKKQWVKEAQAIRNLINRYKELNDEALKQSEWLVEKQKKIEEQEKIIELMAKEYVCKGNKNKYCRVIVTKEYGSCAECVIESFRKKARGNNANNNSR